MRLIAAMIIPNATDLVVAETPKSMQSPTVDVQRGHPDARQFTQTPGDDLSHGLKPLFRRADAVQFTTVGLSPIPRICRRNRWAFAQGPVCGRLAQELEMLPTPPLGWISSWWDRRRTTPLPLVVLPVAAQQRDEPRRYSIGDPDAGGGRGHEVGVLHHVEELDNVIVFLRTSWHCRVNRYLRVGGAHNGSGNVRNCREHRLSIIVPIEPDTPNL